MEENICGIQEARAVQVSQMSDSTGSGQWLVEEGVYECRLVASKSRVAPLKRLTIPRLELQAAVIAARLAETIVQEFTFEFKGLYFFSDSMIVLRWLKKPPGWFKLFVSVRVAEIQGKTGGASWRHVAGTDNPADDLSKGINDQGLKKRWMSGPEFLTKPEGEWPQRFEDQGCDEGEEAKAIFTGSVNVQQDVDIGIDDIQSWEELLEAYKRQINNGSVLEVADIQNLEAEMLRRVQKEFP
ncbi:PREDICTED: uncharacterized protein LOC106814830 [Priapulus caudatus]|uniref:Uncharacterized protein LOC106814830 n=1 Tax=Priapulus caudatus TaxID=37621 RepID=A0ABM1ER52_PRICU|nr:PREDICTED: uncharacterized protein LOC106814830 [Priapulus caudatus]